MIQKMVSRTLLEREKSMVQNSIMMLEYKKHIFYRFIGIGIFLFMMASSTCIYSQNLILDPKIEHRSFITSDRVKLEYVVGGTGDQTLVFVPGWLMPAEIFNAQLNYFSKNYRVISFSPRSQGQSDVYLGANLAESRARDIKELLEVTKTQQFILIGWSLGVMESLDYINRFGINDLKALVLIDNSIGEGTPPKGGTTSGGKMTSEKFAQYVKGFVKAIFKSAPPPDFIQKVENSALRLASHPENAFSILHKPYPREYYRDTVYKTNVPIWYAITPRYSDQALIFSEKHPQGEFKIYEKNAGHALFVDQADQFNLDLENFLRKLN
jgi:microsomal epoxide hydrolase